MNIAVVVPTFNRKVLLVKCIKAIASQSLKPSCIYIVDNHSSDGTEDFLKENHMISEYLKVEIRYRYLSINGGGAMGFSLGMQMAIDDGNYDAFWMLDDDGLPDNKCLEYLSQYVNKYGYVSPLLMDINNPSELNVPYKDSRDPEIIRPDFVDDGIILNYCNPFNGGLFSKEAVRKVGIPKKELFIYGDEQNYHLRMVEADFVPYGIFKARHLHPILNVSDVVVWKCVNFKPVKWRTYCVCRNSVYNKLIRKESTLIKILKLIYYYLCYVYFFIIKNPSIIWLWIFHKAYFAGLFQKWGGQYKYLNK
jgi:rhamnopyranosyl-N-acetylglucosaminyl-diphospho-decaprenol beta-1,3/1,4-galactofuranosyltransferase